MIFVSVASALYCLSIASKMQRMHSVGKSSKHEFMGPIDVKFCSIAFCLTVHVYGLLLRYIASIIFV